MAVANGNIYTAYTESTANGNYIYLNYKKINTNNNLIVLSSSDGYYCNSDQIISTPNVKTFNNKIYLTYVCADSDSDRGILKELQCNNTEGFNCANPITVNSQLVTFDVTPEVLWGRSYTNQLNNDGSLNTTYINESNSNIYITNVNSDSKTGMIITKSANLLPSGLAFINSSTINSNELVVNYILANPISSSVTSYLLKYDSFGNAALISQINNPNYFSTTVQMNFIGNQLYYNYLNGFDYATETRVYNPSEVNTLQLSNRLSNIIQSPNSLQSTVFNNKIYYTTTPVGAWANQESTYFIQNIPNVYYFTTSSNVAYTNPIIPNLPNSNTPYSCNYNQLIAESNTLYFSCAYQSNNTSGILIEQYN